MFLIYTLVFLTGLGKNTDEQRMLTWQVLQPPIRVLKHESETFLPTPRASGTCTMPPHLLSIQEIPPDRFFRTTGC